MSRWVYDQDGYTGMWECPATKPRNQWLLVVYLHSSEDFYGLEKQEYTTVDGDYRTEVYIELPHSTLSLI